MDASVQRKGDSADKPAVADARGKLQVVISDEGFEAGRLNTVSIVVSNPFDVPVEILDIEAPKSSHLGSRRYSRSLVWCRASERVQRWRKNTSR